VRPPNASGFAGRTSEFSKKRQATVQEIACFPRSQCYNFRVSAASTFKPDETKPLDFTLIGEPLNKLLIATGHKIMREWPTRYSNVTGARELFVMHVRTSAMTYRSALYLCADKPPDPLRLPEFCISIPVLNRSILDSLFTVLFILEAYQTGQLGSGNQIGERHVLS
jgi:hypothetical protein